VIALTAPRPQGRLHNAQRLTTGFCGAFVQVGPRNRVDKEYGEAQDGSMTRVLFVDDGPHVLHALRRSLRTAAGRWDMRFASNAAEAMDAMSAERFDVVVADLLTPGADGCQLLMTVRARWPEALRVLTTGSADAQIAVNDARVAHQLLSKPYTTVSLEAMVDRAMRLRALLQDAALANLLSGLDRLPTLPRIYAKLTDALRDPSRSMQDIGKLIAVDASLSANVLQLVNSAFFGLPRQILSPAEAASFLGIELLQSLVLATEIFRAFSSSNGAVHVEELWMHSMAVAARAKEVASLLGSGDIANGAFAAGLMHEIGSLMLFQNRLPQYLDCLGKAAVGGNRQALERSTFGTTSARLGAYVLATWGLPEEVVMAVAFHGSPAESPERRVGVLTALHIAHGTEPTAETNGLDLAYVKDLGLLDLMPRFARLAASRNAI
jgi:HD-like signal output (HDOD) protein/CheY-like chemotaxis protein